MVLEIPRTRLYCDHRLGIERPVQLGEAVAHRLRSVLRLGVGDCVRLFNAECGEWLCKLSRLSKKGAEAIPRKQIRQPVPNGPSVWLLFAPLKKDALDILIEKSVELGVDRLLPTTTAHTDVGRVNMARMRARAIAAAEQCERLSIPEIDDPKPITARLKALSKDRIVIACAEAGPVTPLLDLAREFHQQPVCLMTGPEGGFAKSELDAIAKLPFVHAAGLGPRVLRAETAAIAALAIWQSVSGDSEERPPLRP
ncbi:MAG: 16S rRNA (uracil(1498)-N(3))-methyltransferase [Pseudomonadota bacterium]